MGTGSVLVVSESASPLRKVVMEILALMGLDSTAVDCTAAAARFADVHAVDLAIVFTRHRARLEALASILPVAAIVDPAWHWTAEGVGARCLIPLLFDLGQFEDAIQNCLGVSTRIDAQPGV